MLSVHALLDQNLSPRLCKSLTGLFESVVHVHDFNLQNADDLTVWEFARQNGYAILSKDSDFHQRSFLYGHPPKVIWVRLGNVTTDRISAVLQQRRNQISEFEQDEGASFLIID